VNRENNEEETVKKGTKIFLITVLVIAVAAAALYAFRARIFSGSTSGADGKNPGYSTVTVTRGDISMTVSASGKLEPIYYTTIRPDPNLPARRLVRVLVSEGQRVKAGQALAEIDSSGLDLDLQSAKANYEAQKLKLASLKALPTAEQLAQSKAGLEQARQEVASAQESYESAKSLADKNLASKNQLADAERQLTVARAQLSAAEQSYQTVQAGSTEDVIQAQEAEVAQAENTLQKAKLILDSTVIRSPAAGRVTNILVQAGDLVDPSTAIMSVADMGRMVLQAQVNEADVGQVKIGQTALVTPAGYPDLQLKGRVTGLDLTAEVEGNVSVFNAAIEVANGDGQLLWGMSADADIQVLNLTNVLTLPNTALQIRGGSTQVFVPKQGKLIPLDVQVGPSDGVHTEIVSGLEQGQEVAVMPRGQGPSQGSAPGPQGRGGLNPGTMFRALH
jgi:multidrug efflux pump subunit AcrA (membrane-fusion protein)